MRATNESAPLDEFEATFYFRDLRTTNYELVCFLHPKTLSHTRGIKEVGSSKLNGIGLLCVIEIIGLYFIVRNGVFTDELSAALRVHLLIFNDRGH